MPPRKPANPNTMLQTTNLSDHSTPQSTKIPTTQLADSWEDEASSSTASDPATPASPTNTTTPAAQKHSTTTTTGSLTYPAAPPPTPVSPRQGTHPQWDNEAATNPYTPVFLPSGASLTEASVGGSSGGGGARGTHEVRPEKTAAVAGRLIAGALGVKAPRPSEEQRAYERAVREGEARRRDREREETRRRGEEAERAKKAMWDD